MSPMGRLQHLQPSPNCPIGTVSRQRLATWLRGAEGAALVGHEKERRHCDPSFASSPAPPPERWPRASTRPRWPVDAKAPHKTANVFIYRLTRRRARVGWGFDRRRDRCDAGGSLRSANHHIERGPLASARTTSKLRNPLNPAVQAGFRRTASRRAEPLPSLSLTQCSPARSGNCTSAAASADERMAKLPTQPNGRSNDMPVRRMQMRILPCPVTTPPPHRTGLS